jgi:hypothetical protein
MYINYLEHPRLLKKTLERRASPILSTMAAKCFAHRENWEALSCLHPPTHTSLKGLEQNKNTKCSDGFHSQPASRQISVAANDSLTCN